MNLNIEPEFLTDEGVNLEGGRKLFRLVAMGDPECQTTKLFVV
jgi:hypothetical protein